MDTLKPALVRQLFLLLLILFVSILIFKETIPYLSGVLGAITLYVLLKKWMIKLVDRGWKPGLAAGLLIFLSIIGILVPITGIAMMLTNKIGKAVTNSERILSVLKTELSEVEEFIGYDITHSIDPSSVSGWLSSNLQGLAGGTFNAFIAVGIMYFMLYYMLTNTTSLRESLITYIPLGKDNLRLIGEESRQLVRSNALGIPLVALVQGILALIGFLIFQVPDPFFWFVITAIGSMIPFIGTAIGVVPPVILLFANDMQFQAIALVIYGFVVVGSSDNIIRLYVLERLASVHPLITLFGVVVGVPLFGFIGLIFGPLLVSLFLLIVKIYRKEYGNAHQRL